MSRLQPPYCGVSRRQMLAGSAALLAAPRWGAGLLSAEDTPPSKRLRVLAYNVYECTGWPKDRVFGKKATQLGQMQARFAQELALYEPDLIVLSESPREEVTQQIAKQLGLHHARFLSGGKWPGTLLSRYEIRDAVTAPVAAVFAVSGTVYPPLGTGERDFAERRDVEGPFGASASLRFQAKGARD
jgi:hypothetical protein